MALWGNSDNLTIAGAPTGVTVVGTASSEFWTAFAADLSNVPTGTTILLDGGDAGFVTIESFIAPDLARVGKMSGVGTDVNDSFAATYCNQPISLKNDPAYAESAANTAEGISTTRTQVIAGIDTAGVAAAGLRTDAGGGFHAGWVGIMTYVDMHGTLRTKTETFVAASGIETGNRPYPV